MLEFNNEQVYIIKKEDKPIKIIIENNSRSSRNEKYKLSLKEVLLQELKELKCNSKITTQQYRSERGKVKRSQYAEVIHFLNKRNITQEYIDNEVNKERDRCVFCTTYNINNFTNNFGVINLEH